MPEGGLASKSFLRRAQKRSIEEAPWSGRVDGRRVEVGRIRIGTTLEGVTTELSSDGSDGSENRRTDVGRSRRGRAAGVSTSVPRSDDNW